MLDLAKASMARVARSARLIRRVSDRSGVMNQTWQIGQWQQWHNGPDLSVICLCQDCHSGPGLAATYVARGTRYGMPFNDTSGMMNQICQTCQ